MKSGNVLLGVLAGVAAGALLGVLMAPDKGSKTRKQITGLGDDYAATIKAKFGDLVDKISGTVENEKKSVDKIAGKVKSISEKIENEMLNGTT